MHVLEKSSRDTYIHVDGAGVFFCALTQHATHAHTYNRTQTHAHLHVTQRARCHMRARTHTCTSTHAHPYPRMRTYNSPRDPVNSHLIAAAGSGTLRLAWEISNITLNRVR